MSCFSAAPADLEEVGEQEVGEVVGLGDHLQAVIRQVAFTDCPGLGEGGGMLGSKVRCLGREGGWQCMS